MLNKNQLEAIVNCNKTNDCQKCIGYIDGQCTFDDVEIAETALAYRKMLERYELEWRTGYEINCGLTEIPKTETEYWEIVELLGEVEG